VSRQCIKPVGLGAALVEGDRPAKNFNLSLGLRLEMVLGLKDDPRVFCMRGLLKERAARGTLAAAL